MIRRTAVTVAAVLILVLLAALLWAQVDGNPDVAVRSWTDAHGRACTQVTHGPAVAVDCDYLPTEDRFGAFLDSLDG